MHRVLVTGGGGFIGHRLVSKLVEEDCTIIIVDNFCNTEKQLLRGTIDKKCKRNSVVYTEDIRNAECINKIFQKEGYIDTCVHLAGINKMQESLRNPSQTIQVNVNGTFNVLQACIRNKVVNFVFASSAAVYGNCKKLPISEDSLLEPISPYGASKVAAEALISYHKMRIPNAISLRLFNVFGKDQFGNYTGVLKNFADRLSRHLPPIIYGSGEQTRDFISVNDVVRSILLAVNGRESDENNITHVNNIFNIGSGKKTKIYEIAKLMMEIYGLDTLHPVYSAPMEGDIIHSCANITKAERYLKFVAEEGLEESLRDMLKMDVLNTDGLRYVESNE